MSEQQNETRAKPVDTLREGSLRATIWRNEGEKGPYMTTDYSRSYKDNNGEWKETRQMRENDHLPLRHLSGHVHDRIMKLKREHREERAKTQVKSAPTHTRSR